MLCLSDELSSETPKIETWKWPKEKPEIDLREKDEELSALDNLWPCQTDIVFSWAPDGANKLNSFGKGQHPMHKSERCSAGAKESSLQIKYF